MLNFSDVEGPSDEKAARNLEIRTRPSDKERMSRAAELTGVRLSTFVGASAAREAGRVLRGHQNTVLSRCDRLTLLEALVSPPPTTTATREAVRGYRTRIANAG